jgi:ubiquitin-like domain-containing CTD phosphatase 1
MGTRDSNLFVDPKDRNDLPEVWDDFDTDFKTLSKDWHRSKRNGEKLDQFTAQTAINEITPPRLGKKLLVLDLDHTLLDFARDSVVQRPGLVDFLTESYLHYDLVVWSQTSWRWLELKLTELGLLDHAGFKFCFVLDKTSMFSIVSRAASGDHSRHPTGSGQRIAS